MVFEELHDEPAHLIGLVPPRQSLRFLCGVGEYVEQIEPEDDEVVGELEDVVLPYRHEMARRSGDKGARVALCETEEMLQLQIGRAHV